MLRSAELLLESAGAIRQQRQCCALARVVRVATALGWIRQARSPGHVLLQSRSGTQELNYWLALPGHNDARFDKDLPVKI